MVTKNIKIDFSSLPYNSGSVFKVYTNIYTDKVTGLTTGSFEGLGYDFNVDEAANKVTVECTGGGICVGTTGTVDIIPIVPTPTPIVPTPTPIIPTPTPDVVDCNFTVTGIPN